MASSSNVLVLSTIFFRIWSAWASPDLTRMRLTLIFTNRDLLASPYLRTSSVGNELNGNDTKEKLRSGFAMEAMNCDSFEPCFTPVASSETKTFWTRFSRISFRVVARSELDTAL